MSNNTPKKLTINAPVVSDDVEPVEVQTEAKIPSFMTEHQQLPDAYDYDQQIVETAATLAHIAPTSGATPQVEPTAIVRPEETDRSQPVFERPAEFDAVAHQTAIHAEETDVPSAATAIETPIEQAAQPAVTEPVAPPAQPDANVAPFVAPNTSSDANETMPATIFGVPTKYAYGGLAAAIAVLAVGLFIIPMDETGTQDTAATISAPIEGADLRKLASKVDTADLDLANRANGALTVLGVQVKKPQTAEATLSGTSLMKEVSAQIVADLGTFVGQQGSTGSSAQDDLAGLIAQAIATDQSDAVLRAIITDAINKNQLTVPGGLVNAEGEIDTATLVEALMQITAEGSAVDPEYQVPPQRTFIDGEVLVHRVVTGESLASISLRYYGNTFDYPRIFAANTDRLASPDQIRVGQRLVIPQ